MTWRKELRTHKRLWALALAGLIVSGCSQIPTQPAARTATPAFRTDAPGVFSELYYYNSAGVPFPHLTGLAVRVGLDRVTIHESYDGPLPMWGSTTYDGQPQMVISGGMLGGNYQVLSFGRTSYNPPGATFTASGNVADITLPTNSLTFSASSITVYASVHDHSGQIQAEAAWAQTFPPASLVADR